MMFGRNIFWRAEKSTSLPCFRWAGCRNKSKSRFWRIPGPAWFARQPSWAVFCSIHPPRGSNSRPRNLDHRPCETWQRQPGIPRRHQPPRPGFLLLDFSFLSGLKIHSLCPAKFLLQFPVIHFDQRRSIHAGRYKAWRNDAGPRSNFPIPPPPENRSP